MADPCCGASRHYKPSARLRESRRGGRRIPAVERIPLRRTIAAPIADHGPGPSRRASCPNLDDRRTPPTCLTVRVCSQFTQCRRSRPSPFWIGDIAEVGLGDTHPSTLAGWSCSALPSPRGSRTRGQITSLSPNRSPHLWDPGQNSVGRSISFSPSQDSAVESLPRPPAQVDDLLKEVEGDVHLAGLERPLLAERQPESSRHLHLAQPHPFAVSRKVLHEDREHDSG